LEVSAKLLSVNYIKLFLSAVHAIMEAASDIGNCAALSEPND
jgi:hypothetical protein